MNILQLEEERKKSPAETNNINFYVIAAIFVAILLFDIANSIEPVDDTKLDFFEAARAIGFGAVSIFAFVVAKRYWGSQVFGRAYLALGIGYAFYFAGDSLWYVFEIGYQVANPYPYYPDIGYFGFYPFAIYHLRTNVHYFKRILEKKQKGLLIFIPVVAIITFSFFSFVPIDAPGGIGHLTFHEIPQYDPEVYKEFAVGLAYIIVTSIMLAYVIVGFQVFRHTILGASWGLLLCGLVLEAMADYHYYYFEIFGDFDRSNPVHGIWMASTIIICYALYKHRTL